MQNLFDLTGKKALVTGGSKGIGNRLARGLHDAGAEVVIFYNSTYSEQMAQEMQGDGPAVYAIQCNVADRASLDSAVAQAAEKLKLDPEQINEKLAELTKDDYIFCIGDSITYGFEVEGVQTWIGRLRREEEINLINVGVNGDTTADMIGRFHEHVLDYRPKAVLIMGGGNDVMGGTQMQFVTNNIAMMAQLALDRGIIPMIGIQPEPDHKNVPEEIKSMLDYDQVKENLAELKQWLITFAKANNLPLIDFDTGMKNRLRAGYGRYFFDGIHPNPSGHRMMAIVAKEAFVKMGLLKEEAPEEDHRFDL